MVLARQRQLHKTYGAGDGGSCCNVSKRILNATVWYSLNHV